MDQTDLRHSVEYGNWVTMESLKYNNKASKYFGQPLRLFDEQGKLLCSDTIRRWYDVPHYIWKLDDPVREANINGSDGHHGASDGGYGDWYLYRLAEAYLLRAEAKFTLIRAMPLSRMILTLSVSVLIVLNSMGEILRLVTS